MTFSELLQRLRESYPVSLKQIKHAQLVKFGPSLIHLRFRHDKWAPLGVDKMTLLRDVLMRLLGPDVAVRMEMEK